MHLKTCARSSDSNSNCNANCDQNCCVNDTNENGNSCTSIYISQPAISSTILVNAISNSNLIQIENSESSAPILTIQVNQDNQTSQISTSSTGVNVVNCFRAASPTVQIVKGSENPIQNLLQNVSVHNNQNQNNQSNNEELVNNENNQNIVSISNKCSNKSHSKSINSEDLNEICIDQIVSENNSNSDDYQNTMDMDKDNKMDKMELIKTNDKIVITTTGIPSSSTAMTPTTTTTLSAHSPNQTIQEEMNRQCVSNNQSESANKPKSNGNNNTAESQMSREQRRRERRQRRQAQNHRQHVHVSVQHQRPQHPLPHHSNTNSNNSNHASGPGHGNLHIRPNYEILPDIINNHLPPPYTTLPLQLPPPMPVPQVISPVPVVDDCRFSFPIPVMRRSPSERSGKGCCGQLFSSPPLRGLIAMVALGGVACVLGGAALGASGLAGPPTTHFTVSLLMIGVGMVLVTISGVAWKMTNSDSATCLGMDTGTEYEHCNRQQCMRNNGMTHGLLYPEFQFQHRAPPPSYQASMQEYRLRLLLLDRDRQSHNRRLASTSSPPPTYRSTLRSHRSHLNNVANGNHVSGTTAATGIFGGLSGILNSAINCSTNRLSTTNVAPPNSTPETIINNNSSQQSSIVITNSLTTSNPTAVSSSPVILSPSETNNHAIRTVVPTNDGNINGSTQNRPNNKTFINQNDDVNDNGKITKVINSKLNEKMDDDFRIKADKRNFVANECDKITNNNRNDDDESGLITIVTISGCVENKIENSNNNNNMMSPSVITMKNSNATTTPSNSNSKNEMDILAHL